MRTPRPALVLLLCVLIPASLSAQQSTTPAPPPVASDPQAVALLQKALSALGAAVTDVTLTGTARRIAGSDDETGTATLKATSLSDSRVDLVLPTGNRSEIRNHSASPLPGSLPPGAPASISGPQPVGAWSGPDGNLHAISYNNILTDATWFLPALTITRVASAPNYIVSYVGQESHDGQSLLHVSATQAFPQISGAPANNIALLQHLSQMEVYLDPTSLLPVALAFNAHPDNNALIDLAIEIRFSDYRVVNGSDVPFHVQKYLSNGLVLDLQFADATLNSSLAASNFQIP